MSHRVDSLISTPKNCGCLTLYFQLFIHYGKEGVNTFDGAYVDYLPTAKLNQEAVHISIAKKCRLL